jgi:hypothetical protein
MGKPETKEYCDRMLQQNLERAIYFLRFAEAKNAALLTLASALAIALANILLAPALPDAIKVGLWFVLILVMTAGVIALSAFMPRLNLLSFLGGHPAGPHSKNLLYFGDIASLTIKEFRGMLEERYGVPCSGIKPEYIDDLIVQLLVNSQITDRKMRVFRAGCGMMAMAGAGAIVLVLAYGIISRM